MSKIRADKLLSQETGESRSEIKKQIKRGTLIINQSVIKDPGYLIDTDQDDIMYQKKKINYRHQLYIMLHKPAGIVSAVSDDRDTTVIDYISKEYPRKNLFPAGRLDKDTEGLLIITDDGPLAHQLLSPKKHVPKEYYVVINGQLDAEAKERLVSGIMIDEDYCTKPALLKIISENESQSELLLTISEGKYHQIKRMIKAVGLEVTYLKRIKMGPLELDPLLKTGEFRELTAEEISLLRGEK